MTNQKVDPAVYELVLALAMKLGIVPPVAQSEEVEPKAPASRDLTGWIKSTGECPVTAGTKVDVTCRDGTMVYGVPALEFVDHLYSDASPSFWRLDGWDNDIVLWRPSVVSGKPFIVEV